MRTALLRSGFALVSASARSGLQLEARLRTQDIVLPATKTEVFHAPWYSPSTPSIESYQVKTYTSGSSSSVSNPASSTESGTRMGSKWFRTFKMIQVTTNA